MLIQFLTMYDSKRASIRLGRTADTFTIVSQQTKAKLNLAWWLGLAKVLKKVLKIQHYSFEEKHWFLYKVG